LGDLAVELAEQGLIVLVPATAHRKVYRDRIRAQCSQFIEVWMTAPLAECRRRDAKSLYARFAAGDVHALPGEDQAYEAPQCPEVTAHGGEDEQAVAQILSRLPEPVPKHTTVTP
jgi:adenylylsulfate kinase